MGTEARARLGLWALIGVTLFSFNQVFEVDEYVGPSLLGALAAALICMAARRIGLSTFVAMIASVVGLLVYVTLVFALRTTMFGLPTGRTVTRISDAVVDAYRQSQIDYSPIPTRTGYVILIVAGLWIIATIGETATFRWRLPLVASIGPIALFSLAIVVGTGEGSPVLVAMFLAALLTYWALESSHRMRSWGRWVTPWAHQTDAQPESVTAGLARRMGYSTVAAALVAPFFLPAIGNGLLSWRSDVGGGPGGGSGPRETTSGRVDPWVQLDPQSISQSSAELLRVTARTPDGEPATGDYWRIVSLNSFDGGRWTNQGIDSEDFPSSGPEENPAADAEALIQVITIKGLVGNSLPAAVQPYSLRFDRQVDGQTASIDDTGSLRVSTGTRDGLVYRVVSATPDHSVGELRAAETDTATLDAEYLEVPETVSPEVVALTERWTRGAETDFDKLVALQSRLRDFSYDLDVPPPDTGDYLTEFLLDDREGFCQQFATAFALQARILNMPSRVNVGFLPGSAEGAGDFIVHGTDAHAWPEVYFGEELGWVRFEPTPRPDSTIVPEYSTQALPGVDPGGGGAPNSGGGKQPGQLEVETPTNPNKGGGSRAIDPNAGAPAPAPEQSQWQRTFATLIRVVALGLLVFLALVPLLKEWRTRRRYQKAIGARAVAGAAFIQFEEEAADLASPRKSSESAQTFAERLTQRGEVTDRPAMRLAQIYEAAVFAPRDLESSEGAEAKALAGTLRQEMWSRASWWTRIARLFSPRSLWA